VAENKIFLAKNGKQAIDIATHNGELDLIILDVMMDGMDGFETCQILKQDIRTKDIPVLFISALSNTINKVKGFKVGGVDYITKPFQADEVIARVKTHMSLTKLRKELEVQNKLLKDEIDERKQIEIEKEKLINELKDALLEVKTLRSFIPICANCKSIRNDEGYWEQVEVYMKDRINANFSHSLCPTCVAKLYPKMDLDLNEE
jgi:PleD family two-component response regulator